MVEPTAFNCEAPNVTSCLPQRSQRRDEQREIQRSWNLRRRWFGRMTLAKSNSSLSGCCVVFCVVLPSSWRNRPWQWFSTSGLADAHHFCTKYTFPQLTITVWWHLTWLVIGLTFGGLEQEIWKSLMKLFNERRKTHTDKSSRLLLFCFFLTN